MPAGIEELLKVELEDLKSAGMELDKLGFSEEELLRLWMA